MGLPGWLFRSIVEPFHPDSHDENFSHSRSISSHSGGISSHNRSSRLYMGFKSDFNAGLQTAVQNTKNVNRFAFEDLKAVVGATLGEGGFGKVLKGCLSINGRKKDVAIKIRNKRSGQGDEEFLAEIGRLGALNHPNIVKLVGFAADEDERALVYEYMPQGTLDSHLYGRRKSLDWHQRMAIAAGIARALKHLHKEVEPPLIHFDVKPCNILLSANYTPKLADFGLTMEGAKGEEEKVFIPQPGGTFLYAAPEINSKWLTNKCDVYSFGMSLFELIMGKSPYELLREGVYPRQYLVELAMDGIKDKRKCVQLADRKLKGNFSRTDLQQALSVALSCLHKEPKKRPSMEQVEQTLSSLQYKAANVLLEEDYWLLFFWP